MKGKVFILRALQCEFIRTNGLMHTGYSRSLHKKNVIQERKKERTAGLKSRNKTVHTNARTILLVPFIIILILKNSFLEVPMFVPCQ